MPDTNDEIENGAAQRALQIAFQTMQERCHQLENRLAAVEEENIRLRVEKISNDRADVVYHGEKNEPPTIQLLQDRIEELIKQKSQLTHHVLMVAAENRQLWNRLTRLTRTNKSLGSKLIKISDTLKKSPNTRVIDIKNNFHENDSVRLENENDIDNDVTIQSHNKDISLEEISLRLINSIMMEKSELEQQCSEMVQLQNSTDIDARTVGFTYPDDSSTDSLQQLKQHDARLGQIKHSLQLQQSKLKVLINLKKLKKSCENVCQTGTQFDSDDSLKEHGATQTSLSLSSASPTPTKHVQVMTNNKAADDTQTCPICGAFFGNSVSFHSFHEHVCSHFVSETTAEFQILP